jgi:hypothetical protein
LGGHDLPAVCRKNLTVDLNGGPQSCDGGLLLLHAAARKLVVRHRLAAAMPDLYGVSPSTAVI